MYSERDKKQQVGFKSGNGKRPGMDSMQEQLLAKVKQATSKEADTVAAEAGTKAR
jgi:hypothetical protein